VANVLEIIPLGGIGEFGMNCTLLRYGDEMLILDAGMGFPAESVYGVDICIPDFEILEQYRNEITAVTILGRRMVAAALLVKALGGGWSADNLPWTHEFLEPEPPTRKDAGRSGLLPEGDESVGEGRLRRPTNPLPSTINSPSL